MVIPAESKRWSNLVFAGLFALALMLFSRILLPFLMPVLLGGFLVVLFMPVQDFLCQKLKDRRTLAAGLSTLTVFLLILVPLALVGWMVAREVIQFMDQAQTLMDRGVDLRSQLVANLPRGLGRFVPAVPAGSDSEKAVMAALSGSASVLTDVLSAGTELVVNMFLMSVAMYYFFLDGRRFVAEVTRLIPLDRRYINAFAREFTDVAYAIIYGNTLTALVQGLVGTVGLVLAKVPHAGVWGGAMVVTAFLPVGGTGLVWGPIGVGLLLTGKTTEGLFLLAWGAFLVGTIDNIIRPRLCGSRMTLHPLLVFLSMFGGMAVFGMMGLLVGPLIASLFMAMVRIYRRDFLGLVQLPEEGSASGTSSEAVKEPAPVTASAAVTPASPAALEA